MAIPQTTVNGPLVLPDGSAPTRAVLRFELASWDKDSDETILSGPVDVVCDANGDFSVALWASSEGVQSTTYAVTATYYNTDTHATRSDSLGIISVPVSGPVLLSDLLVEGAVPITTPEGLALMAAYLSDAEDAATQSEAAYAGIAVIGTPYGFKDYDAFANDVVLSTTAGPGLIVVSDGSVVWMGGYRLIVDAANGVIENGNGVKARLDESYDSATVKAFGAAVDGSTNDTFALQESINSIGKAVLPRGRTYINGAVNAEGTSRSWDGMEGFGHESILQLGASGYVSIQNQDKGGPLGTDHGVGRSMSNLTIDGGNVAQRGVLVGTNVEANETDVSKTANYQSFYSVSIMDVDGPAWDGGYLTACSWFDCYTKDCDYGHRFVTNTSNSASDVWQLFSCSPRSHNLAGVAALSNSPNAVSGAMHGGLVNENTGWGLYFRNTVAGYDTYKISSVHLEKSGSSGGVTRANVSIPEPKNDGTANIVAGASMEPGALYVSGCNVSLDDSAVFGTFIHVASDGILNIRGGSLYAGTDASGIQQVFKNSEAGARINISGSPQFNLPTMNTIATLSFADTPNITGSSTVRSFMSYRMADGFTEKPKTLMDDCGFESGLSGFVGGSTPPTSIASTADNPKFGAKAMRVQFSSTAGGNNLNDIVKGIGTIGARQFVACSFYAYSNVATTIKVRINSSDGNNAGTATIALPASKYTRVGVLWRNRLTSDATGATIRIYPEDTDAPRIDFDAFDIAVGESGDVLPVLQGAVALSLVPTLIKGTMTLSPGSIAVGTTWQSSAIAVSGSSTGDGVQAIPTFNVGGLTYCAFIVSGNMYVNISNNTLGAITPSSTSWKYVVSK